MSSFIVNSFLIYVIDNVLYATIVTTAIFVFINISVLNKYVLPNSKQEKRVRKEDSE